MNVTEFNRRIHLNNPLAPYTWEVRYSNGSRLRQFDHDGHHTSLEIDSKSVTEVIIHGHPHSPINIPAPFSDRIPDEVIIKAQVSLECVIGESSPNRTVRYYFGYRYGSDQLLLEIDDLGRLYKTNTDCGDESWNQQILGVIN